MSTDAYGRFDPSGGTYWNGDKKYRDENNSDVGRSSVDTTPAPKNVRGVIPNKFKMVIRPNPGYVHSVTKNAWGDYEVDWADGYHKNPERGRRAFYSWDVEEFVEEGFWQIVEGV